MPKAGAFYTAFLLLMFFAGAFGQTVPSLQQQMRAISVYNNALTPDKIFIQTDKQNYNKEDTIWFKAYLFDAATMGVSVKSGLLYIEIADENNRVVNRNMVALTVGLGWGNISLVENRFPEGTYTLRAYTNWMRNFDEHYTFTRQFTIDGPLDEDWMINSRFELNEKNGINNVKTNMTFVKNDGHKMFAEELKVRISAGRRTLYRTNLITGVDGSLDFDFNLPEKTGTDQLNISLTKKGKREKDVTYNVPVIINRDEKTDMQFMPESGSLINGLLSRVAFKAINEEGKGVDVSGGVYNNTGQKVADFKSIHLGMGSFELKPVTGETYTARINYNDKALSFQLPKAKQSGLTMRVDDVADKDSIVITITPTADIQQTGGIYYLVGQARNVVNYGAMVNAAKGSRRFSISRATFPTGICRFTLLSTAHSPVAERIVFVNHHDQITLTISPSKAKYGKRDSVSLDITATDKKGEPVYANFSIAVTDDAQVMLDSTSVFFNLPAKVLLADDLKGDIENPGWYFAKGDTAAKAAALDVLLLTQGWINYNWDEVFAKAKKPLLYKPEPEFAVRGRVSNAFNKPLAGTSVVLLSTKPLFVIDTITNLNGEFNFTNLNYTDTVTYNVQAKNKHGRMFNVGIEVDEYVVPVFKTAQQRIIPPYVNIDTTRLNAIRTRQLYITEEAKISGVQLKEVQIKARKIVKDSKSLLEPGEADFILNEEDIKAQGKTALLDILKKNVPRFNDFPWYNIGGLPTVFIVDAVSTLFSLPNEISYTKYITELMEYFEATDIKGIEVMTTGDNKRAYTYQYLGPGANPALVTFIEITTYSGNGIFKRKTPGTYIYRPPVFASTKTFYSPKYTIKTSGTSLDTRPTLFWAPNVVTDATDGRASVSFYTGDKPASYTINVQGADMSGLLGTAREKLKVMKD